MSYYKEADHKKTKRKIGEDVCPKSTKNGDKIASIVSCFFGKRIKSYKD